VGQFVFTAHSYPDEPERWLQKPVGKYLEIIKCAMEPHEGVRQIDLCCGLGFGKTLLAIQIAVLKLDSSPRTRILFLEPDWDRVNSVFLEMWREHVPPELYHHEVGNQKMIWLPTSATLRYKPRVITGAKSAARDRRRGPEYTDVLDDETAIQFDRETFTNTLARVRAPGGDKTYITLTTPQVGPYGRFLKRGGNIIFRGRTADNHYLLSRQPDYEQNLRAAMSTEQARRELDGELIALEGRIWKEYKDNAAWPEGNIHHGHRKFNPDMPWWLFCDFGSANGAYLVVQCTKPIRRGRNIFDGHVWVAVADYCPDYDASANRAFQKLKGEFGIPVAVVGGKDTTKIDDASGHDVAYFCQDIFGHSRIYPTDERFLSRQIQYDTASFLVKSAIGHRRFCVAKDFVSLDQDSNRGIREMFDEDAFPPLDKRRANELLPKSKDNVVQHIRDAFLMGAVQIMHPPDWLQSAEPTG
jgi:hypothetical protein